MRVILSAAGRAFLRDFAIAFLAFATGILNAPNYTQAAAIATAGSLAALVAGVRAIRVFIPGISAGIANALHVPVAFAEVAITGITTILVGFVALAEGVFSAPDLAGGKAAALAGVLGIGTALVRLGQSALTPGEPGPAGISTPAQPVPPEALPATLPK
jgi:hypothetical protein